MASPWTPTLSTFDMLKFFLLFFAIQGVLFTLELMRPVRRLLIEPFTAGLAGLSAWIVGLFDSGVQSSGIVLHHVPRDFAVSIEAGCNGVEAMIVLAAAVLAFPASWKHKVYGLLLGFAAIQVLNLVRIISLFYLGQWNYDVFQWAHLYLWQALIMLDALIFWLVWIRMLPRSQKALFSGSGAAAEPGNNKAARVSQTQSSRKKRRKK